ncbi:MAG: YceI family protein [Actinomycetota bacterium]
MTSTLHSTALPTGTWTLVPDATTVHAAVRKLLVVDAPASIELVSGSVVVDADGDVVEIEALFDAASYDSGNVKRDAWATGPSCLDAAAHPHVGFRSRDVRVGTDETVAVGTVRVKGVDTAVLIDVSELRVDDDVATVRASVVIDRKAVGLGAYPSALIARRIPITITAQAQRTSDTAPT